MAKNRGRARQHKEKIENEWISRGLKQGQGLPEKTNGLVGAKNRGQHRPT